MNKTLATWIAIGAAVIALTVADQAKANDACENMATLAGLVMESRQKGVPMVKAYNAAGGNNVIQDMVVLAYEMPRFNTASIKERAIKEYANKWFLSCIKSMK